MASAPHTGRLLLQCPDRPGIVAAVSGVLHRSGANIIESHQYSTGLVDGSFFMRTVFALDGAIAELEQGLGELATDFSIDWRLADTSVRKHIAVMVSRYDHCLLDLLWRAKRDELGATIGVVVSNHPDFKDEVEGFGLPFVHIPVTKETKAEAEARQLELMAGQYDLVVLARYMQVLSPAFLERVGCPVMNIHHSFLPAFAGAGPYERAKARGVKLVGATAHYVTEDLDEGPIVEQDVVRVTHHQSVQELIRRGANVERMVLSRAVRWHCEDRVLLNGDSTVVFI